MKALSTVDHGVKPQESYALKQTPGQTPEPNCALMIKLTAAGDQSAFAALYDNTSGLIYGLLLRILSHSQTAEEILEQVYLEIWKQAGEFDEEHEKALTWLITIAHRRGLERLYQNRNKQLDTKIVNNSDKHLPEAADHDANISERGRLVRAAVNALTTSQREILELAYFSGMKESEIAEYLGQPVENVRLTLRLAMKKLSALFSFLDL
jgi:RNA polymerase sigma-70 factor (ECF subfamily)